MNDINTAACSANQNARANATLSRMKSRPGIENRKASRSLSETAN